MTAGLNHKKCRTWTKFSYLPCFCFNNCFAAVSALQSPFDKERLRIHYIHWSFSIEGPVLGFDSLSFRSPKIRGSLPKHFHVSVRTHLWNTHQKLLHRLGSRVSNSRINSSHPDHHQLLPMWLLRICLTYPPPTDTWNHTTMNQNNHVSAEKCGWLGPFLLL